MPVMYEFRCPKCHKGFTEVLDPHSDDLQHQPCPSCKKRADRVWDFQLGHIDWVNGGFHGDDINLGLGRHFASARERDNYAAKHGLVRQDKAGIDVLDTENYNRKKAKKERIEKRMKER